MHANHAAFRHRHRHALATLQTALGQRPQQRTLLGQSFLQPRIPPPRHLTQERQVLRPARKIPPATQEQRLLHRALEVPVRRLCVPVLVTRRRVRLLHHHAVVPHQLLVTLRELALVRQVVHRRAQAIAAMPLGQATQFPQRVLQPFTQTLKTLREADRHRLPVRVRQHAVIHQVLKRLAADGHAQVVHRGEVRGAQSAGEMDLGKEDFLGWARRRPPVLHAPLQRPHLTILEPIRVFLLQPLEQRLGLQLRFLFQLGRHFLPHAVERIGTRPPVAQPLDVAGQLPHVSVPPGRFAIHAGLGRRR